MRTLHHILYICFAMALIACRDSIDMPQYDMPTHDLSLNPVTSQLFHIHQVTSRQQNPKTLDEQEIKTLHVFIFDTDGQYLEPATDTHFQSYKYTAAGNIPMAFNKNGWLDPDRARHATVIALANLEAGTFTFTANPMRRHPEGITQLSDLLQFTYHPLRGRILSALPEDGMPMYGRLDNVDLTTGNTNKSIDLPMQALMARIDFDIRIDGNNYDLARHLPQFTATRLEAINTPLSTYLTTDEKGNTPLTLLGKKDFEIPLGSMITIQHHQGELHFQFYVFENLQSPNGKYNYPDGISKNDYQRYKPLIADASNALALRLSGTYLTHNGGTYHVVYTLYLGANHTDDFKVRRNHQYKNHMTIRGIDITQQNTGPVTLDARVDISQSNPFYIAMLRERRLDAHFNIVPMDIHFFNTHLPPGTQQSMDIEILNPTDCTWLRMEKIPAHHMSQGTLPSIHDDGPELLKTGIFKAGHGIRRYFTTSLVSHTLSNNTHVKANAHRDRIYIYVDENLEVWHLGTTEPRTRTAQLRFTYRENDTVKSTHELTVEQARLLEVKFHPDESNGFANKTFYMEAYEEYLDHRDPLDNFDSEAVYTGLPWGAMNSYIGRARCRNANQRRYGWTTGYISAHENWYWGWEFTPYIVSKDISSDHIGYIDNNTPPTSAALYCLLKNKRNNDGSISRNGMKWYLPAIREVERMLEHYYLEYEEFQNNYYWSSTPGYYYGEDIQHARATKAYREDNAYRYYESSAGHTYTGENGTGGYTQRLGTKLRIRAARIDNRP